MTYIYSYDQFELPSETKSTNSTQTANNWSNAMEREWKILALYKLTAQCENIISCLSLGFILNMEQEATKGCSGVSIDAPDPGQGLCTISFAGVSQRANINVHCCCG